MPCNCNKRKKRPAPSSSQRVRQAQQSNQQEKPAPKQPQQGGTQTFALTMWDGKTYRFGSRLEAEAYNRRAGGGGTVRPA